MMREILFRGLHRRNGEKVNMAGEPLPSVWVYGYLTMLEKEHGVIQTEELEKYPIYADTVGQYTGLTDKNGVKIFEGDILEKNGVRFEVVFTNIGFCSMFALATDMEPPFSIEYTQGVVEVLGNIYDNPELLGGTL